jgi:hypothetical protein
MKKVRENQRWKYLIAKCDVLRVSSDTDYKLDLCVVSALEK